MKVYYSKETDSMIVSFKYEVADGGNSELHDGVFLMHNQSGAIIGFEFIIIL